MFTTSCSCGPETANVPCPRTRYVVTTLLTGLLHLRYTPMTISPGSRGDESFCTQCQCVTDI